MFCQSCGSKNSPDAKFCNQCGTKIAQAGDAGGLIAGATAEGPGPAPVAPTTPPVGGGSLSAPASAPGGPGTAGGYGGPSPFGGEASMMSVSLAAIGVKSSKKVWIMMAVVALVLVALGALGSWLLRGEPEVVAEAGHAEPEDPFVIGTPLPEGEEAPPEGVDVVPGPSAEGSMGSSMRSTMTTARTTMRTTMTGSETAGTGTTRDPDMTATMSGTGTTMTGTTMTGSAMSGTTGTEMSGTSMSGTGDPDTTMTGDTTMTDPGMTGSMASTMLPTEGPEETDLELELYGSRVRFVVRRYYAARAQACFDRATRNNPSVSGTVVVNMTIGADGAVSRTSVARNTTGDSTLGNCLSSQVGTWRLPPPPGGSLQMQMPFSR